MTHRAPTFRRKLESAREQAGLLAARLAAPVLVFRTGPASFAIVPEHDADATPDDWPAAAVLFRVDP